MLLSHKVSEPQKQTLTISGYTLPTITTSGTSSRPTTDQYRDHSNPTTTTINSNTKPLDHQLPTKANVAGTASSVANPSHNDLPCEVVTDILSKVPAPEIDTSNAFSILEHCTFLDPTSFTVDLSHYSPRQMDTTTTSCPQRKATRSNPEPSSLPSAGHRI